MSQKGLFFGAFLWPFCLMERLYPVIGGLFDATFLCDVDGFQPFFLLFDVIPESLDGDGRECQDNGDVHEDHETLAEVGAVPGKRGTGDCPTKTMMVAIALKMLRVVLFGRLFKIKRRQPSV